MILVCRWTRPHVHLNKQLYILRGATSIPAPFSDSFSVLASSVRTLSNCTNGSGAQNNNTLSRDTVSDCPQTSNKHEMQTPAARFLDTFGHLQATASGEKDHHLKQERQRRLADRGHLIDTITDTVPQMLSATLPKESLADDIVLRILPVSHPHIPAIIGRTKYQTTMKLLQFFVTTMLLPPTSQIQILSARVVEDSIHSGRFHDMSKFVVHWRTVSPESNVPGYNGGDEFPGSWTANLQVPKLARTLSLLPNEYPVLVGIFEFEFSPDCQTIASHSITDLEYLSKPEVRTDAPAALGA